MKFDDFFSKFGLKLDKFAFKFEKCDLKLDNWFEIRYTICYEV